MRFLNAPNVPFGEDKRSYSVGTSGVVATDSTFLVTYDNARVSAYLNGVRLIPTTDYSYVTSGTGNSITLISPIGVGSTLELVGWYGLNRHTATGVQEDKFVVGTSSTGSGGSYTNSTTVFPVTSASGDLVTLWKNGVKLVEATDYVASNTGNTVTLQSGSEGVTGDEVAVQVVSVLSHAGAQSFSDETQVKIQDGMVMNESSLTGTHVIPSGYNAFLAGPVNITGTVTVTGALSII